MLDGLEVTLYISKLLKETYENYKIPIEVYTDNFTMRYVTMRYYASLYYALQSSKYITDKLLRIDICALKEIFLNK